MPVELGWMDSACIASSVSVASAFFQRVQLSASLTSQASASGCSVYPHCWSQCHHKTSIALSFAALVNSCGWQHSWECHLNDSADHTECNDSYAYKLLATGHATCTHTHKCMHILRAMALSLQRFLSSIDDICDGDCGECKWNFARTLRHLQVCHISTHMCVCM